MTAIVATQQAHEWVTQAIQSGTRFDVPLYAVSPANETPDIDSVSGRRVEHKGQVLSCEVVSKNTARFSIYIPDNIPESGFLTIRTFYLMDRMGRVFAHGQLDTPILKNRGVPISFDVYVTIPCLSEAIDCTTGTFDPVKIATVPTLPPDGDVLTAATNPGTQTLFQKYAGRYGPDGYRRVYAGSAAFVSASEFILNAFEAGGFWLNNHEVVLVQVTTGVNAGRMSEARFYSRDRFVLETPIYTEAAGICIWRREAQELPVREGPRYLVLGLGKNSFSKSSQAWPIGAFQMQYKSGTLPAGSTAINVRGLSPQSQAQKEHHVVFINGRMLSTDQWALLPEGVFRVPASTENQTYSIESFNFVETISAKTTVLDVHYAVAGDEEYFHLPILPQSIDSIWLFHNGLKVERDTYEYKGTAVIPAFKTTKGDTLDIVLFANKELSNTNSYIKTSIHKYEAASGFIALPEKAERNQVLLFAEDRYVNSEQYAIEDSGLRVNSGAILDGSVCTVYMLQSETVIANSDDYKVSGINTGPQWVDPAGKMTEPCRVNIHHLTDIGDDAKTIWRIPPVRDANHVVVFSENRLLDTHQYVYSAASSSLVLNSPLPKNRLIDIWVFETPTDPYGVGDELIFLESQYTTGKAGRYTLPTQCDLDNTFIFVDGKYAHKDTLTWDENGFQFLSSPIGGLPIYCMSIVKQEREGYTTRLIREEFELTEQLTYATVFPYKVDHTLLFKSLVNQLPGTFTIEGEYENQVVLSETTPGNVLHLIGFENSIPLSRLILREDLDQSRSWILSEFRKLMPLYGPYVKWSNLTKQVIQKLACPIVKLNKMLNGSIDELLAGKDLENDVKDLASALGIRPVRMDLTMDVLMTASYGTVGSGAMLGVPVEFNVYKYLEIHLKNLLGSDSFSIKSYEVGKKYHVDDIDVSKLNYTPVARSEIPPIHRSSSFYLSSSAMSNTFPALFLMGTGHDCQYSLVNSVLPGGFTPGSTKLRTEKVNFIDDDAASTFTWEHTIIDDYSGQKYTVVWQRKQYVDPATYSTDYLTLLDAGGAPGYVRLFARMHASYQYNDTDCRMVLWLMKHGDYGEKWSYNGELFVSHAGNTSYLANVSYTENIGFSANISDFNADTGDAKLTINMNSNVGYIRFPANQFMKSMTLPVVFTIYPGIIVNPDGTINVVIENSDLFDSCCWNVEDPKTVVNCAAPEIHE